MARVGERYLALKVPRAARGGMAGTARWIVIGRSNFGSDRIHGPQARAMADVPRYDRLFAAPATWLWASFCPALSIVLWVMARAAGRYHQPEHSSHPEKRSAGYGDPGTVLLDRCRGRAAEIYRDRAHAGHCVLP